MRTLREDHRNDAVSNALSLAAAAVAGKVDGGWWLDPGCAILLSIYIIYSWAEVRTSTHLPRVRVRVRVW